MKLTLLDMVQNILSAMDSDEVNSIGDTVESLQVATIVRETYYDLFSNTDIPTFHGLVKLDAYTDLNKPTSLKLPSNVKEIEWIKYNWRLNSENDYRDILYLSPKEFIELEVKSTPLTGSQMIEGPNGSSLYVLTNKSPTYWTTFDNDTIVFDSYNSALEDTVTQANSLCYGQFYTEFQMVDSYIPLLDANLFPLLLAEAKSTCFINLKQVSSSKEEQRSRRAQVRSQNDAWRANQRTYSGPDYGRKGAPRRRPFTYTPGS